MSDDESDIPRSSNIGKYEVVTYTLTWSWNIYKVIEYQDESYASGRVDYYEINWAGKRPQSG